MNPYLCVLCGGELGHDSDCPFHPVKLAKAAEEEGNDSCKGE